VKLWKGLLAENATQAVAADILRGALRECVLGQDWPVIGHTHDEILMEVHNYSAIEAAKDLKFVMEKPPAWAADLPLAVKMGSGERYGK
jgi:DNA polymerase I-like protein with 3'-5' exonuclease and polymerase domains